MVIPSPINIIALIFTLISQPHVQKNALSIILSKTIKISNDNAQQSVLSVVQPFIKWMLRIPLCSCNTGRCAAQ